MPAELPFINLNLAGKEFEATPLNSSLFTFAGQTIIEGMVVENSTYNHVFLHTSPELDHDDVERGTYIFQPEIVQQMGVVMIRHGFPCRLNQRSVPDCDRNAYEQFIDQNTGYEADHMPDEIPDDWTLDGEE